MFPRLAASLLPLVCSLYIRYGARVRKHVEHDHRERNHQGLDNQLLQRPPPPVRADADVQRRERLGGLLSFYYREAA